MGLDISVGHLVDLAEDQEALAEWRQYGIESFCLLRLWKACGLSLQHRAAIVYH